MDNILEDSAEMDIKHHVLPGQGSMEEHDSQVRLPTRENYIVAWAAGTHLVKSRFTILVQA